MGRLESLKSFFKSLFSQHQEQQEALTARNAAIDKKREAFSNGAYRLNAEDYFNGVESYDLIKAPVKENGVVVGYWPEMQSDAIYGNERL